MWQPQAAKSADYQAVVYHLWGGPPDMISVKSMVQFAKSVLGQLWERKLGTLHVWSGKVRVILSADISCMWGAALCEALDIAPAIDISPRLRLKEAIKPQIAIGKRRISCSLPMAILKKATRLELTLFQNMRNKRIVQLAKSATIVALSQFLFFYHRIVMP